MKVRAVQRFMDNEAGELRQIGDTFEVKQERFDAINAAGFGRLVEKAGKGDAATPEAPEAAPVADEPTDTETETPEAPEGTDGPEALTEEQIEAASIATLKEILEARGVEYPAKAKKEHYQTMVRSL